MNKLVVIGIVAVSLSVYFTMTVFVLPEKFLGKEQFTPIPHLEVEISSTEIKLGESFRINTVSENTGDYGDIHIVSASFPSNLWLHNDPVIVWSFVRSPHDLIFWGSGGGSCNFMSLFTIGPKSTKADSAIKGTS